MKINTTQLDYTRNNPTFGDYYKIILKGDKVAKNFKVSDVKYSCATMFVRGMNTLRDFTKYILKKYENVPKVNFYDYACSDGSETYSYILALLSIGGEEAIKKFCPIIAKDIDSTAIFRAKHGKYYLTPREMSNIEILTNKDMEEFFYSDYPVDKLRNAIWYPKSTLTANAKFSVANILKDYTTINPQNSIVSVRNFWPYLEPEDRENLANGLYSHLDKSSVLIIGDFDKHNGLFNTETGKYLTDAGFKESEVECVYIKE